MKDVLVSWIGTTILAGSGIGLFMKTYGKRIFKGITIARHALDLIDEILKAVQPEPDGSVKISPDEVKRFEELAAKLKTELNSKGGIK